MGVDQTPSVFARSELVVAACVTALNALAVWITHNLAAIRVTVVLMSAAFALVGASAIAQSAGWTSPFVFMVACGVGLYVPYVAFHTTLFERLIAASRYPGNLGFLMYLADAMGYLGYTVVIVVRTISTTAESTGAVLPFFRSSLLVVAATSMLALWTALFYFRKVLEREALSGSTGS